MKISPIPAACAALLTVACQSPVPDVSRLVDPRPPASGTPEGSPITGSDACSALDASPAVVETVTEQQPARPAEFAEDGTPSAPATHATETSQAIAEAREKLWFETPCEADLAPDFLASLQRALKVRGFYWGPVDGQFTSATLHAIRAYQESLGLDSGSLSITAARRLGLVTYPIPPQPAPDRDPAAAPEPAPAHWTGGPVDPGVLWQLEPDRPAATPAADPAGQG